MNERELWDRYRIIRPDAGTYTAWSFCGGGALGDELADLVMKGVKTATASLHDIYEIEGEPLPSVGDLSIILKDGGEAVCIIRTIDVRICRFCDVTPEQAYNEGEGDRSLDYWKKVHESCFTEEMEMNGLRFSKDALIVCQTFVIEFV